MGGDARRREGRRRPIAVALAVAALTAALGTAHAHAASGQTQRQQPVVASRPSTEAIGAPLAVLGRWGSFEIGASAGPTAFGEARGLAVTWGGDLWVTDCRNNRVQHLHTDGAFVDRFGTGGSGNGQFDCPTDVAVRGDDLYVLDRSSRIQQFHRDGTWVRTWYSGTTGSGTVTGIDLDDAGNVYITDTYPGSNCPPDDDSCIRFDASGTVHRFDSNANPTGSWGGTPTHARLGGLWITSDNHLYLATSERAGGVQIDDLAGNVLTRLGIGTEVNDVAVDSTGQIWVTTTAGYLDAYSPTGTLLAHVAIPGARGVTVDQDHVYVSAAQTRGREFAVLKLGVGTPALSVQLTADESTVTPVQTIHYHATVTNPGEVSATSVALSNGPAPACAQTLPYLNPGESWTVDCSYSPSQADAGPRTRTVTVDSAETDPVVSAPTTVLVDGTAVVGTVSEDETGLPVAGAFVVALRRDTLALVRGTATDSNGNYRLTLPAGQYDLELFDPSGGHRLEWYDDKPNPGTFADITPVNVTNQQATTANASLGPTGTIAGHVTEDGTGRPSTFLWVLALRNGSPVALAEGGYYDTPYQLRGLRPGSYTLLFLDPHRDHVPELYRDSPSPAGAQTIPVTAGSRTTIDATIAPTTAPPTVGAISGTVTGHGQGGLGGALVVALRTSDLGLAATTRTAGDGQYSLGVPAGSFYLAFVHPSGSHRFEWYDDRPTPTSFAELTTVTAGSTADAELARLTGSLTGTITETSTGTPIGGAWVVASGPGGTFGTTAAADGTYTIGSLDPANYVVAVVDPSNAHRYEFYADRPSPNGATPVAITNTTVTLDAALDPT